MLLVDLSASAAWVLLGCVVAVITGLVTRRISVQQRMSHVEHLELQRYQHAERMRQIDKEQKVLEAPKAGRSGGDY
jgi:hypothetical protein